MRIVIDGIIFGLQRAGGISRMWADMILWLDGTEHEVTVLMPKHRNVEWQALESQLKRVTVARRKTFRWKRRSFFRDSLYLTVLGWWHEPEVWLTTYYGGMPLGSFGKFATLYDMIPEQLGIGSSYETRMKYKTLKASDNVVVISEYSQKDLKKWWPAFVEKSSVIPVCVKKRAIVSEEPSEPYFVFVGRRDSYKNFRPCAEAILSDHRFDRYKIYVVGGEDEMLEDPRVVQMPTLTPYEVESVMAASAALLYPSLYEGFGIPIVEAFHAGVPVLANRVSSIPEVTGEEYPLADPEHPKTLGDTLERLLEERERWIAYGQKRAELFAPERIFPKYEECFRCALV